MSSIDTLRPSQQTQIDRPEHEGEIVRLPIARSGFNADQATFNAFVELVRRSPEWGWKVGKELGAAAFVVPTRPDPMPHRGIVSIEASFGDRGISKAKDQRKSRVGARFDCQIQVCTQVSRGVSTPVFRGRCDFHDPMRALANAERLSHPTKCRTPFSRDYLEMVDAVVNGLAIPDDMLVGFISTKSKADGGGTIYHDRQMMLASRAGLEAHSLEDAIIFLGSANGTTAYELPRSVRTTSHGKPLNAKFKHQSRGVIRAGYYDREWETGILGMQRS